MILGIVDIIFRESMCVYLKDNGETYRSKGPSLL